MVDALKGRSLGLLGLIVIVFSVCLLTGTTSGANDMVTLAEQPIQDHILVYVGEEPNYGWDFGADWSRWEISFECALFARDIGDRYNEPVTEGSSCQGNCMIRPDMEPGEYPLTVLINRTDMQNISETLTLAAIVDYVLAIEVRDFRLESDFWGVQLILDVEVHVPINVFHLDMVVWEDYRTSPEDFDFSPLEPGEYVFRSDVRQEMGGDSSLTMIGYHYFAIFDGHYMEIDVEEENPTIIETGGTDLTTVLILIAIIIGGTVVTLITWVHLHRKRLREQEPSEEAKNGT